MVHTVKHMDADDSPDLRLGEFEQFVLLALVRLGADAYGATIRRDIEARAGRRLAISAVYTTLERLEQKGLVRAWVGDPTPQRGGRRKKHYALEPLGARALRRSYQAFAAMVNGLEEQIDVL